MTTLREWRESQLKCACGATLMRNISIREGRCQACRNKDGAGRGR